VTGSKSPQVVVLPVLSCDTATVENRRSPQWAGIAHLDCGGALLDRQVTAVLRSAPFLAKNAIPTRPC